MAPQQVYIDHLLLQFSTEEFESIPAWISDNFTVINGGTHTGGLSRNKLIIFSDGTYLELYNWITKPHDWRSRLPGDFALTTLPPLAAEASQQRIVQALAGTPGDGQLGVTYSPPREGGRQTPQGEDIRWKIVRAGYSRSDSTPTEDFYPRGRSDAPFFCHDVTRRSRRVTYDLPSVTRHPSSATGIAGIEVLVPEDSYDRYVRMYTSIVGAPPDESEVGDGVEFRLSAPGVPSFSGFLRVRAARGEAEERFLMEKGVGIYSLIIRSETRGNFVFPIADYLH